MSLVWTECVWCGKWRVTTQAPKVEEWMCGDQFMDLCLFPQNDGSISPEGYMELVRAKQDLTIRKNALDTQILTLEALGGGRTPDQNEELRELNAKVKLENDNLVATQEQLCSPAQEKEAGDDEAVNEPEKTAQYRLELCEEMKKKPYRLQFVTSEGWEFTVNVSRKTNLYKLVERHLNTVSGERDASLVITVLFGDGTTEVLPNEWTEQREQRYLRKFQVASLDDLVIRIQAKERTDRVKRDKVRPVLSRAQDPNDVEAFQSKQREQQRLAEQNRMAAMSANLRRKVKAEFGEEKKSKRVLDDNTVDSPQSDTVMNDILPSFPLVQVKEEPIFKEEDVIQKEVNSVLDSVLFDMRSGNKLTTSPSYATLQQFIQDKMIDSDYVDAMNVWLRREENRNDPNAFTLVREIMGELGDLELEEDAFLRATEKTSDEEEDDTLEETEVDEGDEEEMTSGGGSRFVQEVAEESIQSKEPVKCIICDKWRRVTRNLTEEEREYWECGGPAMRLTTKFPVTGGWTPSKYRETVEEKKKWNQRIKALDKTIDETNDEEEKNKLREQREDMMNQRDLVQQQLCSPVQEPEAQDLDDDEADKNNPEAKEALELALKMEIGENNELSDGDEFAAGDQEFYRDLLSGKKSELEELKLKLLSRLQNVEERDEIQKKIEEMESDIQSLEDTTGLNRKQTGKTFDALATPEVCDKNKNPVIKYVLQVLAQHPEWKLVDIQDVIPEVLKLRKIDKKPKEFIHGVMNPKKYCFLGIEGDNVGTFMVKVDQYFVPRSRLESPVNIEEVLSALKQKKPTITEEELEKVNADLQRALRQNSVLPYVLGGAFLLLINSPGEDEASVLREYFPRITEEEIETLLRQWREHKSKASQGGILDERKTSNKIRRGAKQLQRAVERREYFPGSVFPWWLPEYLEFPVIQPIRAIPLAPKGTGKPLPSQAPSGMDVVVEDTEEPFENVRMTPSPEPLVKPDLPRFPAPMALPPPPPQVQRPRASLPLFSASYGSSSSSSQKPSASSSSSLKKPPGKPLKIKSGALTGIRVSSIALTIPIPVSKRQQIQNLIRELGVTLLDNPDTITTLARYRSLTGAFGFINEVSEITDPSVMKLKVAELSQNPQ
jgi:hypothetical protein